MFKKVLNIIIGLLLLISTSGVAVTRHYCGRTLMSVSIFSTPDKCCPGLCDKCHNKTTFNKVSDKFTQSSEITADLKAAEHQLQPVFLTYSPDQLPIVILPSNRELRKFLSFKAGDTPAFICNFRC